MVSLRGEKSRGARRARCFPSARRGPIALAGIWTFKVQETFVGRQREEPDGCGQPVSDTQKGAAEAAPLPAHRRHFAGQSSSHDTEALSAAGAVRRRSARMPREATVWTVDRRMARSRLTDQFST